MTARPLPDGPWTFQPHPEIWLLILTLIGGYLAILRRWGPLYVSPGETPATPRQIVLFALGVLTLWLSADWPIHEISEGYLFSVHMVQHLAFAFVAAPLLLLGLPDWLLRRLLRPRLVRTVVKPLVRPVPALLLFNAYLVLSHWPAFVDLTLRSEVAHASAHFALMAVSFAMWWPVLSPLSEMPRLGPAARMFYLFLQTIVPTVPASFLTFAETPFYEVYRDAPRVFGIAALTDQRAAGLVMKLGGGLFLWTVIAVLFFRWSAREESGAPDPADFQEFERTLTGDGPNRS